MSETILKIENLSKQYRLGLVGTGTLADDLKRWWYLARGKEDPFLKVGDTNNRATKGDSDYVWALQNINFEVKRGEVLGIIGKNGAGKSTLLKILSKVTGPTTGSIKSRGRIASLLEVGTGFHPELTGKENVFLNGAILGMSKGEIKAKYKDIVEFSGCERYIDTPVKRYSSGMRVRLAFAVAAFLEPDILVIDEVLAVGDAEFQKKAIGKMQDISKGEGRTVLFVSHNMAAVKSLCTSCIILEHGKVSFEGNTEESINEYLKGDFQNNINYNNRECENGIQSVEFFNFENKPITSILVGQGVKIKIKYLNKFDRQLSLAIGFFDNYTGFLFSCRSDIVNVLYKDREGEAILLIDKWPLSEGVYSYNLALHDKGSVMESIKKAGEFGVLKGDFYGTGKLPGHKKAFYIEYNWLNK